MTATKVDGGWSFRSDRDKTFADSSTGQILGKRIFVKGDDYKVWFEEVRDPTYGSNRIFY